MIDAGPGSGKMIVVPEGGQLYLQIQIEVVA